MSHETDQTTSTPGTIWVGVDGSSGSHAAVRYAAHAAQALDLGVHLLHVIPIDMAMSPMFPLVPEDMEPVAHRLLAEASQRAAEIVPADRVTSSLHHGQRTRSLVEASGRARLLVLGRARRSTVERLLTGSVATGVAARSDGCVVVVPADWQAPDEQLHVVVGVKDPEHCADLALRAVRLAADRGGRVTFVHVWDLPWQYDDQSSSLDREWTERARAAVDAGLQEVLALHRDVPVQLRVLRGQAARVLQDQAATADLLLLARRGHLLPRGHLGGTARALLREGTCPVEVVPPADASSDGGDLVVEEGGQETAPGRGAPLPV
ncbi:universal stress protein [Nocardioides aurantiacus]|nr:universal stress protein [Nocardioides aurantiacus]